MLAFHAGANAILVQPFQTKADHHRIPAYQAIMARLKARNIRVSQQVLDNEASAAYKHANNMASPGCTIQFVPPDMH
jgi:response regulator of citrate/malate metabolism